MTPVPRVLMLAFEFPPLTGIGVVRSLKLAKYLPEFGITPVVVTADAPSLAAWFGRPSDETPLDELSAEVAIHRVPCPAPSLPISLPARRLRKAFSLDDEDIGDHWEPRLSAVWEDVIAAAKPDALYVSLPPFSIATVAVALARRSRLPLIVDFRDAWSQWGHRRYLSPLHYQLLLRRERRVLAAAAAIVMTTRQIAVELQSVHPNVDPEKFHVVSNGYDAELPEVAQPSRVSDLTDRFVVGYVGSFYYQPPRATHAAWRLLTRWLEYAPRREDWRYRTPYFFFRALRVLFERRPELRSRVRVRFVGDDEDWLRAQVAEFGLGDVVEHLGRLSHAKTLAFQSSCDALLATSAKTIGGRDQFIAGKTFEYIAAGRPIISFAAEGEQRDFLAQSGVAAICNPDDAESAATALEGVISRQFLPCQDRAFLHSFHRREIARQMARVMATTWTSNTPASR